MPCWLLVFLYRLSYIVISLYIDNLAHGGSVISTYQILQPTWDYVVNDAGTCTWKLAQSQTQVNGAPITSDEFAPKRTDYMLWASDGVNRRDLQAGRLLDVTLESDEGTITCTGKDWLEYLNQPYPFNSYGQSIYTLNPTTHQVIQVFVQVAGTDDQNVIYNATQQKIVNNIIAAANGLSDITYTANFNGTHWSNVLEYQIPFLDETSMLSHLQAIASYSDPLGFDFTSFPNKSILFSSPRFVTNPSTPVILASFVYGSSPVTKVVWHNAGPKATITVGKNSINFWKQRSYAASVSTYRADLEIVDLGQKYDYGATASQIQSQINVATDSLGTLHWNPQKDITLTVIPDLIFDGYALGGYTSLIGGAISFDSTNAFSPYHRVNANYYIVSQSYRTDDSSSNYLLDLGLQQIY